MEGEYDLVTALAPAGTRSKRNMVPKKEVTTMQIPNTAIEINHSKRRIIYFPLSQSQAI
jgi:hypothetical protein